MEILYNLAKTAKLYELKLQPVMQKYDLLKIEIDVLMFLYNNPQFDKASDIVKIRGIAKSHVSKAIDLLYKKGLVDIIQDKMDKRIHHLIILNKANQIIKEGQRCQKEFYDVFFKNMSVEEIELIKSFFHKMNENVKEELKCMHSSFMQ